MVCRGSSTEQAVELLNQASLEPDAARKVDHLKGLLELVARKEPGLLPEFLPHVLELRCDPAVAVRKYLPEFVEGAVQAVPTPGVLGHCLEALRGLLADGSAAVTKRAVLSCYMVFRTSYALVALQSLKHAPAAIQQLWQAALELKAAVLGLAAQPGNDGVRLNAAKFLEQAVLLLTAESVPAVAGVSQAAQPLPADNAVFKKAVLVREAEALLARLVALLKLKLGSEVSGPLAITVIKAAGCIAQQRPQFMGRLLPALLTLASSGDYRADAGADSGVQSSVANALRGSLAAISRSQHPMALAWRKKVADALHALGDAGPVGAASAGPQADRAGKRAWWEEPEASKRARLEAGHQPPQHQQQREEQQPLKVGQPLMATAASITTAAVPLSMQRAAPPVVAAPVAGVPVGRLPAAAAPVPVAVLAPQQPAAAPPLYLQTSAADLQRVQEVVLTLVANRDAYTLSAFLEGLQPAVLADLVLSQLYSLPLRHELTPDRLPLDPWVLELLRLMAMQPAALQPLLALPQQARLPTPPLPSQPVPEQIVQVQPVQAAPKAEAAGVSRPGDAVQPPPKPAPLRLPPGALTFRLEPVTLTRQQEQQLRHDAVLRILQTEKTPSHHLRVSLVARLVAACPADDASTVDAVVEQLLQELHSRGGYMIAVQLLHMLYLQLCSPFAPPQSAAGAAAGGEHVDLAVTADSSAADGAEPAQPLGSSHGEARQPSLTGSCYERTLLSVLRGMRRHLPPSDRTVVKLLLEAPALPMPAVQQYLHEVAAAGSEWSTLALLAARDVILQRPPSRQPVLQFVLAAAAGEDEDTRSKAVRLLANRLFPEASMSGQVEAFAREQLDALVVAPLPEVPALPQQLAATPAATAAGEDGNHAPELPAQLQTGNVAAEAAALAAVSAAEERAAAAPGPSEERAAQLCALYCALCTKKHSLLRHLFEVFGLTSDGGKAAFHRNADGLAKTLGASAPALLAVVQDPPPGSLPLVLHMLHVLTETAIPPQPLVAASLSLHSATGDARVLVPALPGMQKSMVLQLLSALLDLPPEVLRVALQRLVAPLGGAEASSSGQQAAELSAGEPALFSPVEILTALHTLDYSRDPKLLRKAMQAVTVCLSSPTLFPPETLAAAINALLTRVPLPQLFMRTVIQTLAAAPRLRQFIVGVLGQLVGKRVWEDGSQWKGWLMCAQQTIPDSFPAVLQLPSTVLAQTLQQLSAPARQQLSEYAASPQCTMALPQATRDLLTNQ